MPKTYQCTKNSLYFEKIEKNYQVFEFEGAKNGFKVKKDILLTQDILLALFRDGGGGCLVHLKPLIFKKSPHNPLQKNTSCFPIMN